MEASPHTMAGSSSPALSPCSSTNLRSNGSSAIRRDWAHLGEPLCHWTLVLAASHKYLSPAVVAAQLCSSECYQQARVRAAG